MNYLPSANMNYRLRRYELLNGQPFNMNYSAAPNMMMTGTNAVSAAEKSDHRFRLERRNSGCNFCLYMYEKNGIISL